MDPVAGFIPQIRNELLALGVMLTGQSLRVGAEPRARNGHSLRAQRVVVVAVVELGGVFEVDLEEGAAVGIVGESPHPTGIPRASITPDKAPRRQFLRHSPPIQIIGIVVTQPCRGFARIVSTNPRVVRACVPQ